MRILRYRAFNHAHPPMNIRSGRDQDPLMRRALGWTVLQYALLLIVVLAGRILVASALGWGLIALGVALTAWSVWAFRQTRIHLTPIVREGGSHITTGPYRWVRHPMYTSVLLLAAGCVALDPTIPRIIAAVLLVPALVGKLTVEEELLHRAYPTYADHVKRTKRLVPGIW